MDHVGMNRGGGGMHRSTNGMARTWLIIGGIAIVLVILAAVVFGFGFMKGGPSADRYKDVKQSQYQAVFLTNGQVYFGKISEMDRGDVKLTDIYYLQVQQSLQAEAKQSTDQQNLSLAKLGGELHGPEDVMYISDKQVLFWENLKDDSKVVQAIKQNKSK